MKILLISLLFFSCSCIVKKDEIVAPSDLNHHRMILDIDGAKEIGINGSIDDSKILRIRTFSSGNISIRGLGDCGYYFGKGFNKSKYVDINLSELPDKDVCIYSLVLHQDGLDKSSTGLFLLRKFKSSLIKPLKLKSNLVSRNGINWVQLRKESDDERSGISEDREIKIYPSGEYGYLNISGCGYKRKIDFDLKNKNDKFIELNLRDLYRGNISKNCTFDILVNNREIPYKEGATLVVSVYDDFGSFLDTPISYNCLFKIKKCFKFKDSFIGKISVNDKESGWNKKRKCVRKKKRYEVIGLTSNQRIFYGIFDHSKNKWITIK